MLIHLGAITQANKFDLGGNVSILKSYCKNRKKAWYMAYPSSSARGLLDKHIFFCHLSSRFCDVVLFDL